MIRGSESAGCALKRPRNNNCTKHESGTRDFDVEDRLLRTGGRVFPRETDKSVKLFAGYVCGAQ